MNIADYENESARINALRAERERFLDRMVPLMAGYLAHDGEPDNSHDLAISAALALEALYTECGLPIPDHKEDLEDSRKSLDARWREEA